MARERAMEGRKVRVAVHGYGVIGKRVADAVALQDDMELVGVADVAHDYRVRVAAERGYPLYASMPGVQFRMEEAGLHVAGTLEELLQRVDVVVDCTPKGIGTNNRERYEKAGVKAIWQGGEKHQFAGVSFVSQVNYADALNQRHARVVSCNTTALCRVAGALHSRGWVKRVRAVIMRRGTDPWESHENGMINTAIPELVVPSHQGPDAQTVIRGLDIVTMAGAAPFDLSHLHYLMVETTRPVSVDELKQALWEAPRIAFVQGGDGLVALNSVIELMRDLGRPRNDMWEVAVWEDGLAADHHDLYITYQVDNEAVVVPENVDCIRALTGVETSAAASMEKTDRTLGIVKEFLPSSHRAHAPGTFAAAFNTVQARYMEEGFKGSEEPAEPEHSPEQSS
ncbi:MAG TPA: type II glyceraldehyde-3-phosphate dehydrogenase [Chloroflexota bacterium]